MCNLRSKAPESQWPEIALRARGCYEAASPALTAVLRDDFIAAYERELPAVVNLAVVAHIPAAMVAHGGTILGHRAAANCVRRDV